MVDSKVQGGDTTYAMPNFGELPGFAEAARAFQHTGASTEIPEPVLQLIASHEPKISEKDVESLINEVVSKSGLSRSAPQIAEFIAEALSNVGAARTALSSLREVGLRAADAAKAEAGGDETPQQKMTRLWAEIQEIDKSQRQAIDDLYREGKISKETHDNAIAAINAADDHPVGSPEWKAAQTRVNTTVGAAADEAESHGADPSKINTIRDNNDKRSASTEEFLRTSASMRSAERAEALREHSQEVDRSALVHNDASQPTLMQAGPNDGTNLAASQPSNTISSMFDAQPAAQEQVPTRLIVASVTEAPTASPATPANDAQRNTGASVTL